MSNSFVEQYRSLAHNDNATRYTALVGASNNPATTGWQEIPIRDAGTFSDLFTYVPTNTASVDSTITLQKSQVDTALLVTYGADQTGIKENTSDTVSFAATDEAQWEITVPTESGTNTLTINVIACQFAPDTAGNCITFFGATGSNNYSAASTTRYIAPTGTTTPTASETFVKYRSRAAFTAQDLYTYVSANSRTTDTTFTTRKNGGAGGQTVTYTSSQTGAKEDTSGTDSIAVGDDFNFAMTTGSGTQTITPQVVTATGVNTGGIFMLVIGIAAGLGIPAATTGYAAAAGGFVSATATEAESQSYPRFTFTASEMGAMVSANASATGDCVINFRDNLGNSGITVTYTPGQTGLKSDSVHTSEITSGTDEITWQMANAGDGTCTITWLGVLGATTTASQIQGKDSTDSWATAVVNGRGRMLVADSSAAHETGTIRGRGALAASDSANAWVVPTLRGLGGLSVSDSAGAWAYGVTLGRGVLFGKGEGAAWETGTILGRGALIITDEGLAWAYGVIRDSNVTVSPIFGIDWGGGWAYAVTNGHGLISVADYGIAHEIGVVRGLGAILANVAGAGYEIGAGRGVGGLLVVSFGGATAIAAASGRGFIRANDSANAWAYSVIGGKGTLLGYESALAWSYGTLTDGGLIVVSPIIGNAYGYSWSIASFYAFIYIAARLYSPAVSATMKSPAAEAEMKSPAATIDVI